MRIGCRSVGVGHSSGRRGGVHQGRVAGIGAAPTTIAAATGPAAAFTSVAVRADRGHQGIGLIAASGRFRDGDDPDLLALAREHATGLFDIEDLLAAEAVRLHPGRAIVLLRQPPGLVVERLHMLRKWVESPSRPALAATGDKIDVHLPGTGVIAPGVPLDVLGVHATPLQTPLDPGREPLTVAALGAQPHGRGAARNMAPLGEHRGGKDRDLRDRPSGALGNLLDREPGANQCLDLARGRGCGPARAGAAAAPPCGDAQIVIERDPKTRAVGRGQQEIAAVLVDADKAKFLHC